MMEKKLKRFGVASAVTLLTVWAASAADVTWTGAVDEDWFNAGNWDNGAGPTEVGDVAWINDGTIDYAYGENANLNALRLDGGVMNMSGGEFNALNNGNWDSHVHGIFNHTGGTANFNELEVGSLFGYGGQYHLAGGELIIHRSVSGYSLYIGANKKMGNGGDGFFEVSSGSMVTRVGVRLGHPSNEGTGVFSVQGTGAAEIGIGAQGSGNGSWNQNEGSTLKIGIDSTETGVTPIRIADAEGDTNAPVTFAYGSLLDVDFIDGEPIEGSWTVMVSEGTMIDGGLMFADGVDDENWGFMVTNNTLMVGYGLGWDAGSGDEIEVPPTEGRTIAWTGTSEDEDTDAVTASNWVYEVSSSVFENTSYGPWNDDIVYVGHGIANEDSTLTYEATYNGGAYTESHKALMVGWTRSGIWNHNSGTLNFHTGTSRFGYGSTGGGGKGTVNVNGGVLSVNILQLGLDSGAEGHLNINGGEFEVIRGTIAMGLNNGTATTTVSGGRLRTRSGIDLGDGTSASAGTFVVAGSGAEEIGIGAYGSVDGYWVQNAGSTLRALADDGGVTTIYVAEVDEGSDNDGNVTFEAGAILDLDWMPGVTNYSYFDIMTWDGTLTDKGLTLSDTTDTDIWSFEFVDTSGNGTNDTLRALAYAETERGTPLHWLNQYGLTVEDDELDIDGDGLATWQEYIAGTDPTDPDSRFALTSVGLVEGGPSSGEFSELNEGDYVVLTWPSVPGRKYTIYRKSSLLDWGDWTVLEEGIPGEDGEMTYYYAAPDAATKFYKIGVELAE